MLGDIVFVGGASEGVEATVAPTDNLDGPKRAPQGKMKRVETSFGCGIVLPPKRLNPRFVGCTAYRRKSFASLEQG